MYTGVPFQSLERKSVYHDALPFLHKTGPNLTNLQVVQDTPFSLCPLPMTHPTPRRTFTPSEAALILPGHKGAVALLVHFTHW